MSHINNITGHFLVMGSNCMLTSAVNHSHTVGAVVHKGAVRGAEHVSVRHKPHQYPQVFACKMQTQIFLINAQTATV